MKGESSVEVSYSAGTLTAHRAMTFAARSLGLLRGPARVLVLDRCGFVHTVGMKYRIDLWFLAASGEVVGRRPGVVACRLTGSSAARSVVELPAGWWPLAHLGELVSIRTADAGRDPDCLAETDAS